MRKPITIDELNLVAESVLKPFEEVNADPVFWMNLNTFNRIKEATKTVCNERATLYGYTLRVDDRYPDGVIETGASKRKRLELINDTAKDWRVNFDPGYSKLRFLCRK